jgi:hypothetical protein
VPRRILEKMLCPARLSLSFLAVAVAFCGGAAFANDFIPAKFGSGPDSPVSHIRFPEIEYDGAWIIKCGSWVRTNGRMENISCYNIGEDRLAGRKFAQAIERITRAITLSPASVNGRRQTVWVSFSVGFQQDAEGQLIELYPNQFLDYHRYGESYTSPQRIMGGLSPEWTRCAPLKMVVVADIDPAGLSSNAEVVLVEGEARTLNRCKQELEDNLEQASFIPAMHNGEAVVAKYEEVYF